MIIDTRNPDHRAIAPYFDIFDLTTGERIGMVVRFDSDTGELVRMQSHEDGKLMTELVGGDLMPKLRTEVRLFRVVDRRDGSEVCRTLGFG